MSFSCAFAATSPTEIYPVSCSNRHKKYICSREHAVYCHGL